MAARMDGSLLDQLLEHRRDVLRLAVVPGGIGALISLVAWRPWRGDGVRGSTLRWIAPVALGAAAVVSLARGLGLERAVRPRTSIDWAVAAITFTVVLSIARAASPGVRWAQALLVATTLGGVGWLFVAPRTIDEPWRWRVAVVAGSAVLWATCWHLARRRPGPAAPLAMGWGLLGLAIVIQTAASSYSAALASVATSIALLGLALALAVRRRGGWPTGHEIPAVLLALLSVVTWLSVRDYATGAAIAFALPALAPLVAWVAEAPLEGRFARALRGAVRYAGPPVVVLLATWLAGQDVG